METITMLKRFGFEITPSDQISGAGATIYGPMYQAATEFHKHQGLLVNNFMKVIDSMKNMTSRKSQYLMESQHIMK
jgi:ABC-type taurine transport system substrate-binding protein